MTGSGPGILRPNPLAQGLWTGTFPSGLRLIVQEDRRAPVAVANVWVRVGSNREPERLRGWSHGIEHLLFKGTGRRNEGDFAREVAEAGGSTNAGTGYETTNYHVTVPAARLDRALDILGDALLHSSFDPAALDAERKVLVHENHMYDDIPSGFGLTWRWALELAFDVSPYRHPIGGRDDNLLERSRDEIVAFWRSAYRPANMTVVVVGAVDPVDVTARVAACFPVEAGAGPDPVPDPAVRLVDTPPVEPPRAAPRCRVETGDVQKAYAKLVFPTPGEHDPGRQALAVVRRVLGDGRSCRLYRQLVEERKLVDDLGVVAESGPREGVLVIDLETDAARLRDAVAAVAAVCADLVRDSCTQEELDRAATRVLRGHLFGSETVQGQAANLGYSDSLGDLARAFRLPAEIAAVTRADVAAQARRVLRTGGLSAVFYLPAGTDAAACGIPADGAALADLVAPVLGEAASAVTAAAPPARPLPAVAARGARAAAPAPFRTFTLATGTEVWLRRDPSVPVVCMSLVVPGGATGESADQAGLATLTQQVQIKGAGGRDAASLHGQLEGGGAVVSPLALRDYGGLSFSALAGRLEPALDLLALVVQQPDFPEHEIAQERRLALEQLAAIQDNPFQAAAVRLREMLYGDHPYGRPLQGTAASLPGLAREAVLARHAAGWTKGAVQVVASGDLDEDRFLARVEALLAELPGGAPAARPVLPPVRSPDAVVRERITRRQNQAVVLVGWPGPRDTDDRRVPLMLLRELLNGQSGRLFEALRNRRSLCYNTGLASTAGFGQGMLLGYVLTAPETADEARDQLVQVITALLDAPVPAAEFARARATLLGSLLIGTPGNAARAARAARARVYDRPTDDLERVVGMIGACTPAQVQEAAAAFVRPGSRCEVLLGP